VAHWSCWGLVLCRYRYSGNRLVSDNRFASLLRQPTEVEVSIACQLWEFSVGSIDNWNCIL
jgi:hypothetical protein